MNKLLKDMPKADQLTLLDAMKKIDRAKTQKTKLRVLAEIYFYSHNDSEELEKTKRERDIYKEGDANKRKELAKYNKFFSHWYGKISYKVFKTIFL